MLARPGFFLHLFVIVLFQASANMEWDCKLCDPGYFMVSPCANGRPNSTVCEMCKGRSFTPTDNNETSCIRCREPNHVVYSEEDTPIACRCARGFHKRHSTCIRNTFCRPGKGVHKGGCQPCPEGQFSDRYSNIQHCRPWTNCTADGMITLSEGTSKRDAICINTRGVSGRPRHHRKYAMDEETGTVRSTTLNPTIKSGKRILKQKWGTLTTYTPRQSIATTTKKVGHITFNATSTESAVFSIIIKDYIFIGVSIVVILMLLVIIFQLRLRRTGRKSKELKREVSIEVTCTAEKDCGGKSRPSSMGSEPKEIEVHLHGNEPPPYHSQDLQVMNNCNSNYNSHGNWDEIPENCSDLNQHYEEEETSPKAHIPLGFSVSMEFANTPLAHSSESLSSANVSSASWQTSPSSVAYRKRIQERLAQVVTNVLSRSAMEHLVGGLGRDWQALAHRLGLTQAEIDHILNENRSDLDKQIYEMIRRWQQGRTGQAPISELYGALLECNMEELHNKLVSLEGYDTGFQHEPMKDVL